MEKRIAPPPEASVIARGFDDVDRELEVLISHTRRRLSQLTRYTALVLGPHLGRSLFKYLQLVKLSPRQILLVMMTHAGSVVHRAIELNSDISDVDVNRLTNMLNDRLAGLSLDDISPEFLRGLPGLVEPQLIARLGEVTHDLRREHEHRLFLEGASNLLDQPEFRDVQKARDLLAVLEQESVLAEILDKSVPQDGVGVFIGGEIMPTPMRECSMVVATYSVRGVTVGTIGVIGPMRLQYDRVISIVKYVADVFGDRLSQAG
jgi:heat-inducible transcriptional repressor